MDGWPDPEVAVRLTPGQIRAARGALDRGRLDLAAAGLSVSAVRRAEDASPEAVSPEAVSIDLHAAIRAAFEAEGPRFLGDEGEGPGLRLGTARPAQPPGPNSARSASRVRTGFSRRGTAA